jgi:hypothetical protein
MLFRSIEACFGRHMVFHRFDHATQASMQHRCLAHQSRFFVAYRFFAVLIDAHEMPGYGYEAGCSSSPFGLFASPDLSSTCLLQHIA